MAQVELELTDQTHAEFEQLVEEEFVSREQAVEELLSLGLDAYDTTIVDDEPEDDFVAGTRSNVFDTESDPGALDDDEL